MLEPVQLLAQSRTDPIQSAGLRNMMRMAELKVRIQFPPAVSQVRTCLSREFAFLGREAAVLHGVQDGTSGAFGRDTQGAATSG
jgi:hypothetical protein